MVVRAVEVTYFFLDNLEVYLQSVNNNVEFLEQLESVMTDCNISFQGSLTHKYIHILVGNILHIKRCKFIFFQRWATVEWDGEKSIGAFLRLPSDGHPKTPCPHLLAVKVGT